MNDQNQPPKQIILTGKDIQISVLVLVFIC